MTRVCKFFILSLMTALLFTGCDDDNKKSDVNRGRNHVPASGEGSILFENDSSSAWNLQVNDAQLGRVPRGSFSVSDYPPGSYAVHLDQHEGSDTKDRTIAVVAGEISVIRIDGREGDFDVGTFTLQR